MANNGSNILKIEVDGKKLKKKITDAGFSIRGISQKAGFGDRTFRSYLERNEMPVVMFNSLINAIGCSAESVPMLIDSAANVVEWISDTTEFSPSQLNAILVRETSDDPIKKLLALPNCNNCGREKCKKQALSRRYGAY